MARPSKETLAQAKEKGLVTAAAAMRLIGMQTPAKKPISRSTLGRMIRLKEIEPEYIEGVYFFDPEALSEINVDLEAHDKLDGREFLLDHFLAANEQSQSHIDALVRLAYDGPQATIKALLAENQSLRDRCRAADATIAETTAIYVELLKQMALQTVESEKEHAKLKMQQDAFGFLKEKLLPAMIDGMSSTKLMNSFSDIQIEAVIEAGFVDAQQVSILKKELARRHREKQQKPKREDNDNGKQSDTKEAAQSPKPRESSSTDTAQ